MFVVTVIVVAESEVRPLCFEALQVASNITITAFIVFLVIAVVIFVVATFIAAVITVSITIVTHAVPSVHATYSVLLTIVAIVAVTEFFNQELESDLLSY